MKIAILSDLHIDFYFDQKLKIIDEDAVASLYDQIFLSNGTREPATVLIIAGDIGHYNHQNIQLLKILQKLYYKHIICVLGNHDYFLLDESIQKEYDYNSFNKANELKKLINSEPNLYCLDGDVIEIEGIRFGGAMSWYTQAYIKEYFLDTSIKAINNDWQQYNADSKYIFSEKITNFDDMYNIELPKIKAVYDSCDIMITHINPSFKHEHIDSSYLNDKNNTFFTSNMHRYLANGSMKYWVFGHTHDTIEYEYEGVKCICNPMGYPSESYYGDWIWIKSIEI